MKTTWTNFFEYQGKMFLNIKRILVKISEEQTYIHYFIVFLHMLEIKVSNWHEIYLKILTPYKSFPSFILLCPMWVQSGIFICLFIKLNLTNHKKEKVLISVLGYILILFGL